jgi:hypothetical protein
MDLQQIHSPSEDSASSVCNQHTSKPLCEVVGAIATIESSTRCLMTVAAHLKLRSKGMMLMLVLLLNCLCIGFKRSTGRPMPRHEAKAPKQHCSDKN